MIIRVTLDVEAADEPHAVVFNRVLFSVTQKELVHNASFSAAEALKVAPEVSSLKARVKEWLERNDVPVTLVAAYMGLAVGSVKNLIWTNNVNISKGRQAQLLQLLNEDVEELRRRRF